VDVAFLGLDAGCDRLRDARALEAVFTASVVDRDAVALGEFAAEDAP
jgi:hypothetical protein